MRFFVCALDGMVFGFPADKTERIVNAGEAGGTGRAASLPSLFRRSGDPGRTDRIPLADDASTVHHGIIVKGKNFTLLVPKIDIDIEITGADIHPLPALLEKSLPWCSGICFSGGQMILLLDADRMPPANKIVE